MIISFDLDDTLICRSNPLSEPLGFPLNLFVNEPLRFGTVDLFERIKSQGHRIFIYTTSLRPSWRVHLWFRLYGVRVDRVINRDLHDRTMTEMGMANAPSKYPPAFGIDAHVDDSTGVLDEGERWGFRVIVVRPNDVEWVDEVWRQIIS